MAWLSVLAALPEYLVLVPSTYFGQLTDVCDSSYRESSAHFWPPWAPSHIQPVHTHILTCTRTHIHIHTRIYTIFKKQKLSLLLLYLCVRVCICAQMCQGTCGQLCGVGPLLPPLPGFWGQNLGQQACAANSFTCYLVDFCVVLSNDAHYCLL